MIKEQEKAEQPNLPATVGSEWRSRFPEEELSWDDVQPVDIISGLEVGYRLIPLVDRDQGGELLERVKGFVEVVSRFLPGFLISGTFEIT
ncbi:hypothetical protein O9929_04900 [Vibrio lentus]|nr:hypothetical protein [Vibrio lentus]